MHELWDGKFGELGYFYYAMHISRVSVTVNIIFN